MQLKTIEQLEKEVTDLQDELDTAIDEKKDAVNELDEAQKEVSDLKGQVKELESRVEELEEAENEPEYDHTTLTGKMMFACENFNDNDTMDLFVELMYKVRPADLQAELKALIAKLGIAPLYVNV